MIPFEALTELFEIATAPYSRVPWGCAAPPTTQSLDRIREDLCIRIPDDFVRLAAACPSYGSWLASIGDDFDIGSHIIKLNTLFHESVSPEEEGYAVLPKHLIMFNHGHDGDCDCWDTRVTTACGEHPIVYVCIDAKTAEVGDRQVQNFRAYAENFALYQAPKVHVQPLRRRAEQLIQELGLTTKQP
jgi:hypothetical protein